MAVIAGALLWPYTGARSRAPRARDPQRAAPDQPPLPAQELPARHADHPRVGRDFTGGGEDKCDVGPSAFLG